MYIPGEDLEERRKIHIIGRNKKLDWLRDNLSQEPTLIVYRFEADCENIKHELWSMNREYTESIDVFKAGKTNVLLLQCERCESFNLQMCNKIIFYTLDYSFIKYDQMIHRVWRIGQEKPVQINILLFNQTCEENIWNAVRNKQKMSDLFMSIKGV